LAAINVAGVVGDRARARENDPLAATQSNTIGITALATKDTPVVIDRGAYIT
jgi:hypothetical protein